MRKNNRKILKGLTKLSCNLGDNIIEKEVGGADTMLEV
jgi:hypothetical protein